MPGHQDGAGAVLRALPPALCMVEGDSPFLKHHLLWTTRRGNDQPRGSPPTCRPGLDRLRLWRVIHVQTIIEKEYPAPDVDQLCAVFDDHQGDWQEIIRDYERMDKESPNN